MAHQDAQSTSPSHRADEGDCFVSIRRRQNTPNYVVHVLYVPRLANLPDLSYKQLIEQGAVDIAMQFNVPIATLPSEGNPNEVAGGFTVESVRGNRAIVQRLADRQSWVMWFEETEAGPGRHVVVGPRSPEQVFELAQALRRGRPPHERDAAG